MDFIPAPVSALPNTSDRCRSRQCSGAAADSSLLPAPEVPPAENIRCGEEGTTNSVSLRREPSAAPTPGPHHLENAPLPAVAFPELPSGSCCSGEHAIPEDPLAPGKTRNSSESIGGNNENDHCRAVAHSIYTGRHEGPTGPTPRTHTLRGTNGGDRARRMHHASTCAPCSLALGKT